MTSIKCNVCQSPLHLKIYDSGNSFSLTSLCSIHRGNTEVYVCRTCTHVQSVAMLEIDRFYDKSYNILVDSEEEDQVYEAAEGNVVYRTEHQIRVLREKLILKPGTKILDYGCAKSGIMRILSSLQPDLNIHVFDVSDRYRPFWEKFLPPENTATYCIPPEWKESFNLVTSFFSLEHIDRPSESLSNIYNLLDDGGTLYGIVPSFEANNADLIVVDHVNHFTRESLTFLLCVNGFDDINISENAHNGAFVFSARKSQIKTLRPSLPKNIIDRAIISATRIGTFWKKAGTRIRDFEENLPSGKIICLYGAGFYGSFIASWLRNPEQIRYVIDQNPFLQGRTVHGAFIISPNEVPSDVDTILVGLNPDRARKIIQKISSFKGKKFQYFYL